MSWSPLTSFCSDVASVTNAAFLLSLPNLPESVGTRDDVYLNACIMLNSFLENGLIDDYFYDYLSMHLDYSFSIGGSDV